MENAGTIIFMDTLRWCLASIECSTGDAMTVNLTIVNNLTSANILPHRLVAHPAELVLKLVAIRLPPMFILYKRGLHGVDLRSKLLSLFRQLVLELPGGQTDLLQRLLVVTQ